MLKKRIMYVTWDGPQVDYLEGLFLPILRLMAGEFDIRILQFTWGEPEQSSRIAALCSEAGIGYRKITVYRSPTVTAGTIRTLRKGVRVLREIVEQEKLDLVIHRSTLPSLMALAAFRRLPALKRIMDTDGFPQDERVEFGGLRRSGLQFRFLKGRERKAIRAADAVWVRTRAALDVFAAEGVDRRKIQVVENGRDSRLFKPSIAVERLRIRRQLGIPEGSRFVVYCGSLGPQYCLEEMLTLLRFLGKESRLLILTGSPEFAQGRIPAELRERVLLRRVPFSQVPDYLGAADVGLAIRERSFSMKGVSPVKLGEYLLCGLPLVASTGIGDTEEMLSGKPACFLLPDHGDEALRKAAVWVDGLSEGVREQARELGMRYYDLEHCVQSYLKSILTVLGSC